MAGVTAWIRKKMPGIQPQCLGRDTELNAGNTVTFSRPMNLGFRD